MVQVVGIARGITKEKKMPFTVLHLVSDFEDYQKENSVGKKAENVYVQGNITCNIGDKVDLVYGVGFGGKAVVKDVTVMK